MRKQPLICLYYYLDSECFLRENVLLGLPPNQEQGVEECKTSICVCEIRWVYSFGLIIIWMFIIRSFDMLHRSNIVSKILTVGSQTLQTNAKNCWFSQNMTLQFCKRKQKTNLQSTDSKQNFSVLLDISQKQKAFNLFVFSREIGS